MAPTGQRANHQAVDGEPLPAALVVGAAPVLKEPRLQGGLLFWLEQLPAERGRTTLRMRTGSGMERELTPELDLRSRIHGYGGGSYSVAGCVAGGCLAGGTGPVSASADDRNVDDSRPGRLPCGSPPDHHAPVGSGPERGAVVVMVAEGGRSLWRLDLPGDPDATPPGPVRLTPAFEPGPGQDPPLFGDGLIDLQRQRWIGVCEQEGGDRLVTVPLSGGAPRPLLESPDFCGYAALSPCGSHLAWVSWQQPCMPWDRSQLWLGRFHPDGDLVDVRAISGSAPGDGKALSVFQPLWAGADLVVACDRSGWWNLECLEAATGLGAGEPLRWRALLPMQAETAMPQWVYGMRTTAWDGRQLLAAACDRGRWTLGALVPDPAGGGAAGLSTDPSDTAAGAIPPAMGRSRPAPTAATGPGLSARAVPGSESGVSTQQGSAEEPPEGASAWPNAPQEELGCLADIGASGATTPPAGNEHSDRSALPSSSKDPTGASSSFRGAGVPRGPLCWLPLPLPFDDLAALDAEAGRLVAIASGPLAGPGLLELETCSGSWNHHPAAAPVLDAAAISVPETLWFAGHGERPTHAWYYPPRGGAHVASPLLVRGHSGPTAMARTGLSLGIQYWTSRGWGVVDVNYGGSTGFGRAYRERLDGGWGVVDVDDCLAAARALVDAGRADPARIAMEGSSASGFTVLAALARGDTIRAGACRYPVTDLTALAESDHRFEARYFDALVGPWPEARSLYEERSPLRQVERIQAPLLFFHGLDDRVVPPEQSIAMVERLRERGVPVELHLFEGEGHGFRDAAVQRRVLERTEAFFRERFNLPESA